MGPHQGFIYMLLIFKLSKLFIKPVVLLCDILMLYKNVFIKFVIFESGVQRHNPEHPNKVYDLRYVHCAN